jgi:hypothetical protein
VREVRRQEPEEPPTPDDRHVSAILKAQPGGFEAYREVLWKMTRHGTRYMTIPRLYRPLVDVGDFAWVQGVMRAA